MTMASPAGWALFPLATGFEICSKLPRMTQSVSNDPRPPQAGGAETATASSGEAIDQPTGDTTDVKGASVAKPKSPLWWWLLGIACVLSLELFIYGHNGWVRVCVGLQGVTDLTLLDRPKHRDGMKGFPICAEQLNLGMYSRSDDAA